MLSAERAEAYVRWTLTPVVVSVDAWLDTPDPGLDGAKPRDMLASDARSVVERAERLAQFKEDGTRVAGMK